MLVVWAGGLLLADLFIPRETKGLTALLAAFGLVIAQCFSLAWIDGEHLAFNGMVVVDGFAIFLTLVFLSSGLVGVALVYDYLKQRGIECGEYYLLLLFSINGMIMMVMAADLIVVFLTLELLSIPLYVLAGFTLPESQSEEAYLKYFLLGAFAGGFLV